MQKHTCCNNQDDCNPQRKMSQSKSPPSNQQGALHKIRYDRTELLALRTSINTVSDISPSTLCLVSLDSQASSRFARNLPVSGSKLGELRQSSSNNRFQERSVVSTQNSESVDSYYSTKRAFSSSSLLESQNDGSLNLNLKPTQSDSQNSLSLNNQDANSVASRNSESVKSATGRRVCSAYRTGFCKFQDLCHFSHDDFGSKSSAMWDTTQSFIDRNINTSSFGGKRVCLAFRAGMCKFYHRCRFSHDGEVTTRASSYDTRGSRETSSLSQLLLHGATLDPTDADAFLVRVTAAVPVLVRLLSTPDPEPLVEALPRVYNLLALPLLLGSAVSECVRTGAGAADRSRDAKVNQLLAAVAPALLNASVTMLGARPLPGSDLANVLEVLDQMIDRIPSQTSHLVGSLHFVLKRLVNSSACQSNMQTKFKYVFDKCERFALTQNGAIGRAMEKKDDRPEKYEYLTLKLIPTLADLKGCNPELKPNSIHRGYLSPHDMLDRNLRLLGEDFKRPIRDGVRARITGFESQDSLPSYKRVEVCGLVFDPKKGISFQLSFDSSPGIHWTHSKRLIFEAAVCLTADNFETPPIWSTISNRDTSLMQGQSRPVLQVQLIDSDEYFFTLMIQSLSAGPIFEMFENSDAYFLPYQSVFLALQQQGARLKAAELADSSSKYPFQEHLVHLQREVEPPRYLLEKGTDLFDMSLLSQVSEEDSEEEDSEEKDSDEKKNSFEILQAWPRIAGSSMDSSQLGALRHILTKKLAVVQGPPGCGKTFLALKALQLMNQNLPEECFPIVIVAQTNHALDQLLEGILKFCNKIVRIGSRSESAALKEYSLSALSQKASSRELTDCFKQLEEMSKAIHVTLDAFKTDISVQDLKRLGLISEEQASYFERYDVQMNLGLDSDDDDTDDSITEAEHKNDDLLSFENFHKQQGYQPVRGKKRKEPPISVLETWLNPSATNQKRGSSVSCYISLRNRISVLAEKSPVVVEKLSQEIESMERERRLDEDVVDRASRTAVRVETIRPDISIPLTVNLTDQELNRAMTRRNLWLLPENTRRAVFCFWQQRRRFVLTSKLRTLTAEFAWVQKQKANFYRNNERSVLASARFVGLTTTGAAKLQDSLDALAPKIIMVEEAAEILEPHILASLVPSIQHLILIGDHKQLQPSTAHFDLTRHYKFNISLFERLMMSSVDHRILQFQRRMRPEISVLSAMHYNNAVQDHISVVSSPNVLGVGSNVFFMSHTSPENFESETKGHKNIFEANYAVRLALYLLQQGYQSSDITILVAYAAQQHYISQSMQTSIFPSLKTIDCRVLDKYQGEENKIIILSLVRSNKEASIGFLQTPNRVCVALSRAKYGLYILGDSDHFARASPLWNQIVDLLQGSNSIGPGLHLCCQNHPKKFVHATCSEDFDQAPNGGCEEPCGYQLSCGHVCTRYCHHDDHSTCKEVCGKVHRNCGHICPEECLCCTSGCTPCQILVEKTFPDCNHRQNMKCCQPVATSDCNTLCSHQFDCGHTVKVRCFKLAMTVLGGCQVIVSEIHNICGHKVEKVCSKLELPACTSMVHVTNVCGHQVAKVCGSKTIPNCSTIERVANVCGHLMDRVCGSRLPLPCVESCKLQLACGHICTGYCRGCSVSGHKPCKLTCTKILQCQHTCRSKHACGAPCPPCSRVCKRAFPYSSYVSQKQPRDWHCQHQKCTQRCSEPCKREPCFLACTNVLTCGHQCMGLCGEICPSLCRICKKLELVLNDSLKPIQVSMSEPEDIFLELPDCHHFVESVAFDKLVSEHPRLEQLVCPMCNTPILTSERCLALLAKIPADQASRGPINAQHSQQPTAPAKAQEESPNLMAKISAKTDIVNRFALLDRVAAMPAQPVWLEGSGRFRGPINSQRSQR